MLGLIRSWGDSLKLLAPSSLKVWGLLTLKGLVETYKLLFKYFWWLLVSLAVLIYLSLHYKYYTFLVPYSFFVMAVWFFINLLAARPSIAKKDLRYFVGYWAYGLVALVIASIMLAIWLTITMSYQIILQYMSGGSSYDVSYYGKYVVEFVGTDILLVKPLLFTLFFLCDTQLSLRGIFKSIWNGIKLLWYLLPLCILMGLVLKLLDVSFRYFILLFGEGRSFVYVLAFCLLFPFYLHILMYLYIKQIHEHPERYQ